MKFLHRNGASPSEKANTTPEFLRQVDTTALPGANRYELLLYLPSSGKQKLSASSDTSVSQLKAYRSMDGVTLSWEARGKYEGFRITRDGTVIADNVAADVTSFEDKQAPAKGKVTYAIQPTTGKVIPATHVVNLGPADPGGALVYEPFDYPGIPGEPQSLEGNRGAHGTKGTYVYLSEKNPERVPATEAEGLSYGALPVTGNRGSTHRWSEGGSIVLSRWPDI